MRDVDRINDFFMEHYGDIDFSRRPSRFIMLKQLILKFTTDEDKTIVDFVRLLYVCVDKPDGASKKLFNFLWFELDTIKNNCQYITDHPAILQIGIFAFLELLSKLIVKLSLDLDKIQLMHIDFLQYMPESWSIDQSLVQKDPNKSNIQTTSPDEKEEKKLTVEYFGTDLTKEYKDGYLDPVIGREKEIYQMIYTLLRKTKNNPLLIWEAGVGKTAIVEWLAQKIVDGDVPEKLLGKRVFVLDMGSLVAGTKYRGEFEARMKAILEEAMDISNNIILFIDELHTIIGTWGAENGDAAQMIKPLLSRGKIKLIGATTYDEYQKYIEKDAALKRRFQEIHVDEPDLPSTKAILMWLKWTYENYHGVVISEEAVDAAIFLSRRYILNRHLPDKAIDIIDEASARKSTITRKLEKDDTYNKYEKQLKELDKKIEHAIDSQDYFGAAELKEQQENIKHKMQQVRQDKLLPVHLRQIIQPDDIGQVLADKTWIPANIVSESEIVKLKRLKEALDTDVFGQEEAIQSVVKAITRNRMSVIKKDKPISSFLFLWPSGTGKTHLAKMVAKHYFGDEKAMIRVDMSEFMEKYSVSKLIWSAPGYVWHEEGGLLTEQVRRRPYTVVLLDEIEKASKDVLNILLQVLDEWYLKDNKGRQIDFKSTIIIMTSNLGSDEFSKKLSLIGFSENTIVDEEVSEEDFLGKKAKVMERLKDFMSPELFNRLDHIVVFKPLSKKVLKSILRRQLDEFLAAWKDTNHLKLPKFSDRRLSSIVDKIYDPQLGARPLLKYIDNEVEQELIDQLMK